MDKIKVVRSTQAALWPANTDSRNREVLTVLTHPCSKDLRAVVSLDDSTLLLDEDGDLWHLNLAPSPYSLRIDTPNKVKQLASNGSAVVLLTEHGTMLAWGEDRCHSGIFGVPGLYSAEVPVSIACDAQIVQVAVGETHAAALDSNA
jgi:alpha-tubulin suppressor-like RCC1 family protein